MQSTSTLRGWLRCLAQVSPITGVIDIGAGEGGSAALLASENVPRLAMVEADRDHHERLQGLAGQQAGWSAHCVLVSDSDGHQAFHVASNPDESGLVPPEQLRRLWKNLSTVETRTAVSSTLQSLLATLATGEAAFNWLVVDCFPALPILAGAGVRLEEIEVVIARVIRHPEHADDPAGSPALEGFMVQRGYRCVAREEERHPGLELAIYLRDWKAVLGGRAQQLQSEYEALVTRDAAKEEHFSMLRASNAAERRRLLEDMAQLEDRYRGQVAALKARSEEELAQARTELAHALQALEQTRLDHEQILRNLEASRRVEVDGLRIELEQLDAGITRSDQELAKATALVSERDNELGQVRAIHARLLASNAEHLARVTELELQVKEVQKQLERAATAHETAKCEELDARSKEYEAKLAEREAELSQLTDLVAKREADIADECKRAEALERQLAQEVQRTVHASEEQAQRSSEQARIALEAKQRVEALVRASDAQVRKISEQEQRLSELQKDLDERSRVASEHARSAEQSQSSAADLKAELSSARIELERMSGNHAAVERQLAVARSEIERLKSVEASLQASLTDARQTTSLSVRIQTLREADLKDLQARYQASVETRQKQHELLTKLSERLSAASSYFRQLSLNGGTSHDASISVASAVPVKARPAAAVRRQTRKSGK